MKNLIIFILNFVIVLILLEYFTDVKILINLIVALVSAGLAGVVGLVSYRTNKAKSNSEKTKRNNK